MAFYLFISLSITLTSCSGEDGRDGIDGIDGINGEQGPQGPAGEDGNANIIASDWKVIQWDEAFKGKGEMYIEIPEVNIGDFVGSGAVILVYMRFKEDTNNVIHLFPFTEGSSYYDFFIIESPTENGIVIRIEDVEINILDIQNDENYTVRYILVPANVAQTSGIANKMPESFGEAASLLGLDH